jgi:hypothetical protein
MAKLYTSVRGWILRRLALVVAGSALVFALVSTTIAAPSKHHPSKHKKAPAGLTAAQVQKLIASYFKKHPPASGPQGATGAAGGVGQTGASPFVALTTLNFTEGQRSDPAPSTSTWKQLVNMGVFHKTLSSTHEVVTFSGTGGASPGKGKEHWNCAFQLRVDGKTVSGNASTAIANAGGQTDLAVSESQPLSAAYPMNITADFGALSAGVHELSIWDVGSAGVVCSIDPYNFDSQSALLEEIQTSQ